MRHAMKAYRGVLLGVPGAALIIAHLPLVQRLLAGEIPKGETYLPMVIKEDFQTTRERDTAARPEVMQRQTNLLSKRYDLGNRPAAGVMMSAGRKSA
jgi:hypothetical protein